MQERKRLAVLEERRIQEAASRPAAPSEDNFAKKAFKAMGAMEEGDAIFGSNDEINLDSQVSYLAKFLFAFGIDFIFQFKILQFYKFAPMFYKYWHVCRFTGGMINTVQESPSISIVFILAMSGISITRLTMTMTTHLQKLCKATNSTFSTRILLTNQKLQLIILRRTVIVQKLASYGSMLVLHTRTLYVIFL